MPRRTRTPQEKKELSYSRDRRNSYGESDKGSRKRITRRKRDRARIPRRRVRHALAAATEPLPDAIAAAAEDLEGRINDVGMAASWGKCPDRPLRDHVADVLESRAERDAFTPVVYVVHSPGGWVMVRGTDAGDALRFARSVWGLGEKYRDQDWDLT